MLSLALPPPLLSAPVLSGKVGAATTLVLAVAEIHYVDTSVR